MGYLDFIAVLSVFVVWFIFALIVITGAWILATIVTAYLCLTGLGWWCVTILIFLMIMGLFGKITQTVKQD